jgi:hypothetical protein
VRLSTFEDYATRLVTRNHYSDLDGPEQLEYLIYKVPTFVLSLHKDGMGLYYYQGQEPQMVLK